MSKQAIFPPGLPLPRVAYSPLVKAGPFIFISGQLASDLNTGTPVDATINQNFPHHGSDIELQTRYVCGSIRQCLEAGGSAPENVLFYTNYLEHAGDMPGAARGLQNFFGAGAMPPVATIVVEELPIPGCRTEIDLVAIAPEPGQTVEALNPATLPAPNPAGLDGPPLFDYGRKVGPWVFTTGMTATDFAAGVAPEAAINPRFPYYGESARLQTEYILNQLKIVLAEGGATMADVVKAEVYLTDLRDFFRLDEVWRDFFPTHPPARTTVPVADLGVPGLRVGINLIAFLPEVGQIRRTIQTDAAPAPLAHEPQAVQAGPLLFFSSQMATDFKTGVPVEATLDPRFPYYGSESAAQVNYIVGNIEAICRAAGTSSENLVRRRGFYTDFSEFFTSFATWGQAFPSDPPASTTVRVPAPLLVPGGKVGIDLIAVMPDG